MLVCRGSQLQRAAGEAVVETTRAIGSDPEAVPGTRDDRVNGRHRETHPGDEGQPVDTILGDEPAAPSADRLWLLHLRSS